MKVWKAGLVVVLAAILTVVTACSSGKPPKEAVVSAMSKMSELKSYTVEGSFGFDDVVIPEGIAGDSAEAAGVAAVANMLKGSTVKIKGTYQAEPMRTDMTMDLVMGADGSSFNLSIPMIVTQDKMWVKIPSIPGVPLPEEISGKFIELDMKKLAEQAGQDAALPDVAVTQKMGQDMAKVLLDNFDEKTYFSEPKAEEVKDFPADLKQDQIVRFAVTQQNFDQAITTIVDKVAPQILDLLMKNEEYLKALQLTKADLEEAKKQLDSTADSEIKKGIEEIKKSLKVNELSLTGAIKDDYLTYQDVRANLEMTEEAQTMKFAMHLLMKYDNLNKDVKFENELPKDAVSFEELMTMFGGEL
ncbi:hypothetical protein [Paenibacillus spongiae]|uniref:Lipoprotein n=1 Tax=Paenibacillus spongiae TaxID=2909671 RepID=A0ABY5SDP1_9BACL|nr:hypothetical protein [Paenibacillus spongiae]UVI30403.1 hypothetical protein L1F29_00470 [Paenibacillus spongiae]